MKPSSPGCNLHGPDHTKSLQKSRAPPKATKAAMGTYWSSLGLMENPAQQPWLLLLRSERGPDWLRPQSHSPSLIQSRIAPELMTIPLRAGGHGEISSSNLDRDTLDELLDKKTVLAIGPGMGLKPETEKFLLGLLENTNLPAVLDADALNVLSKHRGKISGRDRLVVLTPHPGEMARLAGSSIQQVQANREALAREFAIRHHVVLVLKGWRTLIAHPDGSVAINTTGNPGMAKGGSGDILTGIIAAMVAQYPQYSDEAVNAAVYLHGLAADFAVREQDEHTLLATDTVAHLSRAFRFRAEDKGGYLWIQGLPQ